MIVLRRAPKGRASDGCLHDMRNLQQHIGHYIQAMNCPQRTSILLTTTYIILKVGTQDISSSGLELKTEPFSFNHQEHGNNFNNKPSFMHLVFDQAMINDNTSKKCTANDKILESVDSKKTFLLP